MSDLKLDEEVSKLVFTFERYYMGWFFTFEDCYIFWLLHFLVFKFERNHWNELPHLQLCRLAQEWADRSVLETENPLPKRQVANLSSKSVSVTIWVAVDSS